MKPIGVMAPDRRVTEDMAFQKPLNSLSEGGYDLNFTLLGRNNVLREKTEKNLHILLNPPRSFQASRPSVHEVNRNIRRTGSGGAAVGTPLPVGLSALLQTPVLTRISLFRIFRFPFPLACGAHRRPPLRTGDDTGVSAQC